MRLTKVLGNLLADNKKPIKVIVICDPGVDDLLMLIQILSSVKYEVVGVIPVYGNAKTFHTVQNTINLCEFLGKINVPIFPGAAYDPNDSHQDEKTAVYGQQGLAGITLPVAQKMKMQSITGIDFAKNALSNNRHMIISTASTSDVAKILQQLPIPALKNIIAISLMGGVINHTQEANWPIKETDLYQDTQRIQVTEANLGFDPQSSKITFDICSKYNVPILLAPLDLTHSILASETDVAIIRQRVNNPAADLVINLIAGVPKHYQSRYHQGPDGKYRQPLHDVHASCCLIHPELYHGHWVSLEVRDQLLPHQSVLRKTEKGNIFLLDMHYMNRHDFFVALATDLKNYDHLTQCLPLTNTHSSNAILLTENGTFNPQSEKDKQTEAAQTKANNSTRILAKL